MIKLTNAYLIGIISASLLVGCGGGGDSEVNEGNEGTEQVENNGDNDDGGTSTPTPSTPVPSTPTTTSSTFSADVMPVLNAKCKACHGSAGRFTITDAAGTYANISDLQSTMPIAAKYVLDKGSNTISHDGGAQIPAGSPEYTTIKSWVDAGADNN